VLGESQILGQVKTALEAGTGERRDWAACSMSLFRRAISCGKRARSETEIGRGALSVGSAAVELARQIFGPLQGRTVLILGAGKMSELTAQHLVASGARRVLVANRTYERAQELASLFGECDAPR
jgi:glutamyl-tRNA reductase